MKTIQNSKTAIKKVATATALSLTLVYPSHAQWDTYQAQPQKSFLQQFVLPLVGSALGQGLGGLLGSVVQYFGGKLISSFNAPERSVPANIPPDQRGFNQQSTGFNISANVAENPNVFQPAPPPVTSNTSAVTGVMYAIDRLNPDYSVRETISPQAGVSPIFQSGEKFSIRYTSNHPGVVVILNVDAQQKTFYLGTFVVSPGVDMRFPAETNKGMVLDENTGLETYQMLFMACLPPEMTNQPDVIARKGQIPECGPTAQAEQAILQAHKGRRSKGTYSEALPQADGTRKVVLSVAPFQKGDVTVTTFNINHVHPLTQQP